MRSSSGSRETRNGFETVSIVLTRFGVESTPGGPPKDHTEGGVPMEDTPSVTNASKSDRMMSYQDREHVPGNNGPV